MLGALLQLLVDHDVVPQQHVPAELAPSNVPISVHVITDYQQDVAAGVAIRAVVPVRPTADRELAPPATSLHLDVAPGPDHRGQTGEAAPALPPTTPVLERTWTTVRRREHIAGMQPGDGPNGHGL